MVKFFHFSGSLTSGISSPFLYLDTFKFFNVRDKRFSNNDYKFFDYILTSSRGELPNNSDEDELDEDIDSSWFDIEGE